MTPIQKRIAIAEACGWRRNGAPFGGEGWTTPEGFGAWACPSFLTDLNAMAGARKTLTKHEKLVYQEAIFDAMYAAGKYDGGFASWHYIDAGASEHADAFLVAKGILK